MTPEQDEQMAVLCNGIAAIAEYSEYNFWDVVEILIDNQVIDEENRELITEYMESL